jgi:hypothetical protein
MLSRISQIIFYAEIIFMKISEISGDKIRGVLIQ